MRLVSELPDERIPQVLDDVRRHLRLVRERPWPPSWFASAEGDDKNAAPAHVASV